MSPKDVAQSSHLTTAIRVGTGLLVLTAIGEVVLRVSNPSLVITPLMSNDVYETHVDFDTFWNSAVALTHGDDIYETPAKLNNLNPPLVSVLLAPLAALDVLTAYRAFSMLLLLMMLGSVLAVCLHLRLRPAVTALATLAVLASSPLYGTLMLGQVYPLLLVGLVAGWIAQRRGRPVLASVLFGIVVALKPSLAPILLLAAVQRQWLPFKAGIAGAAVASLIGVLVAGPSSAWAWLRIALSEPVSGWVDNASLPGLAVRFAMPSAIGTVLGLAVLAGTLWWCARHRDRIDPTGTALWAVLAAALLFSPIAWHNYLMLLWPGVLALITLGRSEIAVIALAVPVFPVSFTLESLPHSSVTAAVKHSFYCAVLVGYWAVLVHGTTLSALGSPAPTSAATGDPDLRDSPKANATSAQSASPTT
ncbi:arabinofuranan 3-O-arabinosyltransferase [Nocardia alba]|uniref:Arabinofuranan 3-O-arabinosyltransferase n=1 Tax=Nocardia alba TaxID=225051 RepID=A0A4V2PBX5_9NOCA|nr:arabinofuranan 3-O-arabinosyltransferase [Nocardia alba]